MEEDLLQDLRVLAATVDGHDVHVSLYGGRHNVCGAVRFTFHDTGDRRREVAQLAQWIAEGTLVSLLTYGDVLALFSETDVLHRALECRPA